MIRDGLSCNANIESLKLTELDKPCCRIHGQCPPGQSDNPSGFYIHASPSAGVGHQAELEVLAGYGEYMEEAQSPLA